MATNLLPGLEIPAFGASAASRAARLGATRIELNAQGSYSQGGLTPSTSDLESLNTECPLRIMIRPRGPPPAKPGSRADAIETRDFHYTDAEFEAMKSSIQRFRDSGYLDAARGDGFVFGLLQDARADGGAPVGRRCWVDEKRCTRLVEVAQPFKCVFHRAFDEIVSCDDFAVDGPTRPSWEMGLEAVAACGFDGILTSGGLGRAVDNLDMLEKIVKKARTLRLEIIVGGGVRTANVAKIRMRLGLRELAGSVYLHSACLRADGSESIDHEEVQGIVAQLK